MNNRGKTMAKLFRKKRTIWVAANIAKLPIKSLNRIYEVAWARAKEAREVNEIADQRLELTLRPKQGVKKVPPRQDRKYRCAQCEELCDPLQHDGAYDAANHKPVCPSCEGSW